MGVSSGNHLRRDAYLSGSPHRFADVERTYVDLLARPGVVCRDGEQILDWYLGALRGG